MSPAAWGLSPAAIESTAQLIDFAVADAGAQLCLKLCECLERHLDALSTLGGGTDQLRSTAVRIGHDLDETLLLESADELIDRLTADSETAGQVGLTGSLDREGGE